MLERLGRLSLCWWCALLPGCGAADGTRTLQEEPVTVEARGDSAVNTCPSFAFYLVLPKEIRAGEIATATALATDADSDDAKLSYVWSASAGELTQPDSSLTKYTCTDFGPQALQVTARDPQGCEANLTLAVTCLAP